MAQSATIPGRSKLKDKLIVQGYRLASWLLWKIPLEISYPLATVIGEIYYWLARTHSRNADYNIRLALGETTVNRRVRMVARRSFRNYMKYTIDFIRQSHLSFGEIESLVDNAGWHFLEECHKQGKGLLMVTPHFGNWDIAGLMVTARGYPVSTVVKDFEPAELNELIQASRRSKNIKIYGLKDSYRGLFNALKNNEMVCLLLDAPLRNEGVVIKFMGRYARMASGLSVLAYRTGAPIMLGYIVRQPGNKLYYGCWEPPLQYTLTGDREEDITTITQSIATAMEKLVRRHPDQWYMFRPLFITDEEAAQHFAEQQAKRDLVAKRLPRKATQNAMAEE